MNLSTGFSLSNNLSDRCGSYYENAWTVFKTIRLEFQVFKTSDIIFIWLAINPEDKFNFTFGIMGITFDFWIH